MLAKVNELQPSLWSAGLLRTESPKYCFLQSPVIPQSLSIHQDNSPRAALQSLQTLCASLVQPTVPFHY